ncbi:MAG: 2-amino-4-hydroxy-6-hydroxymethyldihydropteridine diphosphokinase [Bacteroidales bacterium]|nr:2-amino-4-hydroxy-6-hydroxymethyldihydropteridine diphosphokinase [Bacteroidales bacterium]
MRLYLSLGSNVEPREANLRRALTMLEEKWGIPCAVCSSLVETEPWGRWKGTPARFLNAVACFDLPDDGVAMSSVEPSAESGSDAQYESRALSLLADCKAVERALGREEVLEYAPDGTRIYHSRPIDIDILLWGDLILDLPTLQIPHPRMWERDFVLIPLAQVAQGPLAERVRRAIPSNNEIH